MLARIMSPLRDERGNSVVEYALILSLIAMVCFGGLNLLGTNTKHQLESATTSIVNASPSNGANTGNNDNGANGHGGNGGGANNGGDGNHGKGN